MTTPEWKFFEAPGRIELRDVSVDEGEYVCLSVVDEQTRLVMSSSMTWVPAAKMRELLERGARMLEAVSPREAEKDLPQEEWPPAYHDGKPYRPGDTLGGRPVLPLQKAQREVLHWGARSSESWRAGGVHFYGVQGMREAIRKAAEAQPNPGVPVLVARVGHRGVRDWVYVPADEVNLGL